MNPKNSECVTMLKSFKSSNDKDVSLMNTTECTMMTYKLFKCRTWDTYEHYPHNIFDKTIISVLQLMDTSMAEVYHNLRLQEYPTNQAALMLHLPKQLLNIGQIYESKHRYITK